MPITIQPTEILSLNGPESPVNSYAPISQSMSKDRTRNTPATISERMDRTGSLSPTSPYAGPKIKKEGGKRRTRKSRRTRRTRRTRKSRRYHR